MYKYVTTLLLAAALFACAGEQTNREDTVGIPPEVVDAFNQAYPYAEDEEWEVESNGYEVEFKLDGKSMEVEFDRNGRIIDAD